MANSKGKSTNSNNKSTRSNSNTRSRTENTSKKKTEPASSITASSIYTFYSNTARGTYADTSSMTNPDGSSRGSDSNVSSQASKYGDYTKATASYKVKFSTLHDTYWNWYNM